MSRILFINSVCNGSTGTICKNLYKAAEEAGHTCCIAYGRGDAPEGFNTIKIGNQLDIYLHVLKARLFDASGFGSKKATKSFIKQIEEFKPDVIHLHNIHGYYVNIEILFNYLKQHPEIKKIWTLHDCWSFTGHSAYCDAVNCCKWETGCSKCPNLKEYPSSFLDFSKKNWKKKKEIFNGVENLLFVSPSKWLANLVKKSFLNKYDVKVINNGIDTSVFKPLKNDFRELYHLEDKFVILAVSSVWNDMKGLNDYIELSKILSDEFKIVMVGLTKEQIKELPDSILGLERTNSTKELACIYNSANVFLNLTYCDTYPTVNLEAASCRVPIITYDTGGSSEIAKENDGYIIEKGNIHKVYDCLVNISNSHFNQDIKIDYSESNMSNQYMEEYQ